MHDNYEGMFKSAGPPGSHHSRNPSCCSGGKPLFLTCSILSCANVEWNLNQKIKQVRKWGLPPLVEKGISNTLIPHNVAEHIVDKLSSTLIESKY